MSHCALDSVVVQTQNLLSSPGGFFTYAMYHHTETVYSKLTYYEDTKKFEFQDVNDGSHRSHLGIQFSLFLYTVKHLIFTTSHFNDLKIVSGYDQDIPLSQTVDKPMAP